MYAKKLLFENLAKKRGFLRIAGIDEAGRGPWAGPVVASACILPDKLKIRGIDDSKKLTPLQREKIFEKLMRHEGVFFGVGIVEAEEIDRINILQASIKAMIIAVDSLPVSPDYLLVDGLKLPHSVPSEKIIKGDALSLSIGAASIIAKVKRDQIMDAFHQRWPQYGFHQHKGYGTEEHQAALKEHGPSEIHRMSFKPLQSLGEDEC